MKLLTASEYFADMPSGMKPKRFIESKCIDKPTIIEKSINNNGMVFYQYTLPTYNIGFYYGPWFACCGAYHLSVLQANAIDDYKLFKKGDHRLALINYTMYFLNQYTHTKVHLTYDPECKYGKAYKSSFSEALHDQMRYIDGFPGNHGDYRMGFKIMDKGNQFKYLEPDE